MSAADALAALRAQGADPLRLAHLEALARRSANAHGRARQTLEARLQAALADAAAHHARSRHAADTLLAHASARFPEHAEALAALHAAGQFRQLRQHVARLEGARRPPALAQLLAHLEHRRGDTASSDTPVAPPAPGDPASLAYFENLWAELKVEQQLAEALAQAPENAGPLNSHLLALQSLKLMRDTSPAYLKRFVAYVDALLWLDQADTATKPAPKGAAKGEKDKKRKAPPRGRKA